MQRELEKHRLEKSSEAKQEGSSVLNKLFAHYYCWYEEGLGSRHWNDSAVTNVSECPAEGYYRSYSGDLIEKHIRQAASAGIDGFIVSMHVAETGVDNIELESLKVLSKKLPPEMSMSVMLCISTLNSKTLRLAVALVNELSKSPQYAKGCKGNKSLMCIYLNDYCYHDDVRIVLDEICRGYDLIFFGQDISSDFWGSELGGIASGYSLYIPWSIASADNIGPILKRENEFQFTRGIKVRTICPGYDFSHLRDPRRFGAPAMYPVDFSNDRKAEVLEQELQRVGKRAIDRLTVLTSFNEFHENTHIEPTLENGGRFLEILKSFDKHSQKED